MRERARDHKLFAVCAAALALVIVTAPFIGWWPRLKPRPPLPRHWRWPRSGKSNSAGAGSRQLTHGGLTYLNRSLYDYVRLAYGVQSYQLTHGRAISRADRYDIIAKAAGPVPESQVKLMLQALLEDRFRLVVHRETSETPAYILTVDKTGPRFKQSEDDGPMVTTLKDGTLLYRRTSMAYMAGSVLSNLPSLGRPVVDLTGLDGIYDFSFRLFDGDATSNETDPRDNLLRQLDNVVTTSLKGPGIETSAAKGFN
jgi:uncharacterized protein (TIGR03435 family)